ncbi:hypothetical protein ACX27_14650 [Nostoc piscinale CENA21]|uniref:Uncharacterized protein n=1 Tax=Nostoc piscinale CENA21 TaxID=224013 RepID=A0A0M5ML53_9NOSO|nr:hypothetical protein [Nostoc piscinale]ALF53805.1 hypothetical protein ACX27_14650 [Nostoc piscinale CENA21]
MTFSTPWISKGVIYAPPHWEAFIPPVPVDGWPHDSCWTEYIEADGFYTDWVIYWPSDFEVTRDYDYE